MRRGHLLAEPPDVQWPDRQIFGGEQLSEAVPAAGSSACDGAGVGTPVIMLARLNYSPVGVEAALEWDLSIAVPGVHVLAIASPDKDTSEMILDSSGRVEVGLPLQL